MKCPTCEKPADWQDNPYRPFCSERCKLLDFGAWINGEYAVASEEAPPAPDETSAPADAEDAPGARR